MKAHRDTGVFIVPPQGGMPMVAGTEAAHADECECICVIGQRMDNHECATMFKPCLVHHHLGPAFAAAMQDAIRNDNGRFDPASPLVNTCITILSEVLESDNPLYQL